jgi:hypothetical protein
MKVAIYGDSHAASIHERSINDDISYVEMLYHKYDLTNFGIGGSSLFYSYNEFLKTEKDFDKIVFLVTSPGRIHLNPINHPTLNLSHLHVTGIGQAEWYTEEYSNSSENKKVFQTIKDYILYVQNNKQESVFHELMIQNIKRLRPDALIIEALEFAFSKDTDFSFWNLTNWLELDIYRNFYDLRHCHLSKEKHIILYEMIEENIKTGKHIDYNRLMNVKPSKTFEDYFNKNIKVNRPLTVTFEKYKEVFK